MSWWRRKRRSEQHPRGPVDGPGMAVDSKAVREHFASFVSSRRGVEAFVEPPTNVTATTVILIAHDGEWTRRAVVSRDAAFELPRALGIPVYDVNQTGYPSRMREWNSRQRRSSTSQEPRDEGNDGNRYLH
ncbi:MAG: hypothetical protein QOE58_3372 [Actinomycetota bacterium]|nr:hypothetical protein [Actinomycetota bacterium]